MWWWPGFKEAWAGGRASAWVWAVGWSTWVVIVCRLTVPPSPFSFRNRLLLWSSVAAGWLMGLAWQQWRAQERRREGGSDRGDLFLRARSEYLRGNWYESRSVLEEVIEQSPHHLPARLLLATLLRRSGEFAAAELELRALEVLPDADRWRLEIDRERQWSKRDREEVGLTEDAERDAA